MKTKEIIKFQDILNYYKTKQIEPVYCEELITTGELQSLLDYITNLQEENKLLRIHLNVMKEDSDNTQDRIDKAIEELDKYINSCGTEAEHTLNNEKCWISVRHSKKVKNILNGGDDNGNNR